MIAESRVNNFLQVSLQPEARQSCDLQASASILTSSCGAGLPGVQAHGHGPCHLDHVKLRAAFRKVVQNCAKYLPRRDWMWLELSSARTEVMIYLKPQAIHAES